MTRCILCKQGEPEVEQRWSAPTAKKKIAIIPKFAFRRQPIYAAPPSRVWVIIIVRVGSARSAERRAITKINIGWQGRTRALPWQGTTGTVETREVAEAQVPKEVLGARANLRAAEVALRPPLRVPKVVALVSPGSVATAKSVFGLTRRKSMP